MTAIVDCLGCGLPYDADTADGCWICQTCDTCAPAAGRCLDCVDARREESAERWRLHILEGGGAA